MSVSRAPREAALTGGIGSGKSAAGEELRRLGAIVVDADVIAREVVAPGTVGLKEIVRQFGSAVLGDDGSLDRERMAALVFADARARKALEAIVHPLVRSRLAEQIRQAREAADAPLIVAEIPLLFETGQAADYACILVVDCPLAIRIDRLVSQRGMTRSAARARIDAQMPLAEKVARASCVIDNGGTREALRREVRRVWRECLSLPL